MRDVGDEIIAYAVHVSERPDASYKIQVEGRHAACSSLVRTHTNTLAYRKRALITFMNIILSLLESGLQIISL